MYAMTSEVKFELGLERLTTERLVRLARSPRPAVSLGAEAVARIQAYRKLVTDAAASDQAHYGINTGFGFMADVRIEKTKLAELQENLLRSHACGVGSPADHDVVRGLLLMRAHTFALGHSGISLEVVRLILDFLKHDILAVIPVKGSVGASGDLAPLSHLALPLIGEGEVTYQSKRMPAAQALEMAGLKPVKLGPKEGLSLINGTHFMTTIGAFAVEDAKTLARTADCSAALSLDATRGSLVPFTEAIHHIRPHPGQQQVAANMAMLFAGFDGILDSHKDCKKVQDPYSFRCIPQVHGASRDAITYVEEVITRELNSVTDNPLAFLDGTIISGGNFHGQPVAIALDFLAIAVAEFGSISERRIEKMTNPTMSGLPAFLAQNGGLESGFMIPQYVAAALVSENKVLCHPASVDSIPTSADKEDHVSMGPIAARKAREIALNVSHVLAIEMIAACRGLDVLAPLKAAPALETAYQALRKISPPVDKDRSLAGDITKVAAWILNGGLIEALQTKGFQL